MAHVAQPLDRGPVDRGRQLGLYETTERQSRWPEGPRRARRAPRLCASCRASEARYGFRADEGGDPLTDRPRTLCFECFRVEIVRRQAVADRMARGWNAQQVRLPLEERMRALSLRRRRAQIAARKALGL
jgi:hypothetical protein